MGAEGMRFTDFYVAATVCTPSRAALLTGRLPIRSGMSGDMEHRVQTKNSPGGLPPEEITIARALKSKDCAAQAIGKWHLGQYPQNMPTSHGFDAFYGLRWSNDMEPARGIPTVNKAAQISNLPYRRFVIGRLPGIPERVRTGEGQQAASLRYSRLEICATLSLAIRNLTGRCGNVCSFARGG
jgi:arylsulfatase A-like enzyme